MIVYSLVGAYLTFGDLHLNINVDFKPFPDLDKPCLNSKTMALKTYQVGDVPTIKAVPLTPESFAKFGTVISPDHQVGNKTSNANYGTAVKVRKVSKITNNFGRSPSGNVPTPNWNIFRCSPPYHLFTSSGQNTIYLSKVLERHPFSTQTFLPIGLDKGEELAYIVICAQSNEDDTLVNPSTVEAFICKGNQAVTYNAGTWHAPMVSLVDKLDFGVMIFEGEVDDENCQECYFEPGFNVEFPWKNKVRL